MDNGKDIIAKFHVWKLIRGIGPTLAVSGLLFFLLLGPFLIAVRDDVVSRIEIAGPVAMLLSGIVFSYWIVQIIVIFGNNLAGIYKSQGKLFFFDWKFSSMPLESISRIEINSISFQDRVCLYDRGGRRRVVLTNLMQGSPQNIKAALSKALGISG